MVQVFAANGVSIHAASITPKGLVVNNRKISDIGVFAKDFATADKSKSLLALLGNSDEDDVYNFKKIMDANPGLRKVISKLDPDGNGKDISEKALERLAQTYKENALELTGMRGMSNEPIDRPILSTCDIYEFADKNKIKVNLPKNMDQQSIYPY